jgi:hypothetical protein
VTAGGGGPPRLVLRAYAFARGCPWRSTAADKEGTNAKEEEEEPRTLPAVVSVVHVYHLLCRPHAWLPLVKILILAILFIGCLILVVQ